jgi:hypothetical protein
MAPAAGCPAVEIFVTFVMALSPGGPEGPAGSAPPGAAPAAWPQEPHLASAIPFQVPQGAFDRHSQHAGRVGVPPRRPSRRPTRRTAAIQRSSAGRCLLLLGFRLGQRPVIHRAHPQAPSSSRSRRRRRAYHTAGARRAAPPAAVSGPAMNPP